MRLKTRVAAALATLMLAASVGSCTATAPSETPTETPQPSPTASMQASADPEPVPDPIDLGPMGYGDLELGMTKAQATETGLTVGIDVDTDGACGGPEDGRLEGVPTVDGYSVAGMLFFSTNTGQLIAIYAGEGIATPEGITLGSSRGDLLETYPEWEPIVPDPDFERGYAKVPGNPDAHYRIVVEGGMVTELSLDSQAQDCYE